MRVGPGRKTRQAEARRIGEKGRMTRIDTISLMARLLWQIETDLDRQPQSLERHAALLGVSPFHLTRGFALRTGRPLMAYIRGRRLTEAAKALAVGRENVTGAAFLAGYESAEGFSRAFRARFGRAPSSIRSPEDLTSLTLEEALTMPGTPVPPADPTFTDAPARSLLGLSGRFTMDTRMRIPALWDTFASGWGRLLAGKQTYGVCYDFAEDGSFSYLAGSDAAHLPADEGLDRVGIPAGRYAVFPHAGHVSTIGQTWEGIFSAWAPGAGVKIDDRPEFELYDADFDPQGSGKVAVWIPVA